jgi:hypothetical protein
MAKQNGAENGEPAAMYVAWGTFKNSIMDGMAEGLPSVIDKSIFETMAGGVQSGMMSGLKFLGLIDDDGRPTPALVKLTKAESEPDRKAALAEILNRKYGALVSIGLDKASMKQLLDTLETTYRVSGETREKAARFFISAAQYAGIPLSRYITEGGVSMGRRKPAKRPAAPPPAPLPDGHVPLPPAMQPVGGEQRSVTLSSGGTLTLSASVGFMKLAKKDRDFVFGLIDQLDAYENENPSDEADE